MGRRGSGFQRTLVDKLLVLMDGRTLYSPLTSGVDWEVQDTPLEDIDRIEVIRGPGGTMWGENAVNGVINIVTKHTRDTQGGLASAEAGNQIRPQVTMRYGGRIGSSGTYRVWSKFGQRRLDEQVGDVEGDRFTGSRGGFRTDYQFGDRDTLLVEGDGFSTESHDAFSSPASLTQPFVTEIDANSHASGGSALARWTRKASDRAEFAVQVFGERLQRRDVGFGEKRWTVGFDFQNRTLIGSRHDLMWGLESRSTTDSTHAGLAGSFNPAGKTDELFGGFVQDEIVIVPERLALTVGARLEHNGYTGWEPQPSLQIAWTPTEHQTAWASVAQSVRTPSRADADLRVNFGVMPTPQGLAQLAVFGSSSLEPEKGIAYEGGYRTQLGGPGAGSHRLCEHLPQSPGCRLQRAVL